MSKTNWINEIQRSAKVTSNDTWETLLEVDPLYISDKDLVEQIAEKRRVLTWYKMFRKYYNSLGRVIWKVVNSLRLLETVITP